MVTCHCKTLESSTKPAEKPSIGFRVKSVLVLFMVVVIRSVAGERERKKSVQNVGVAPPRSPRENHHHRPHPNHHPRERQTDKTKEGQEKRLYL